MDNKILIYIEKCDYIKLARASVACAISDSL